MKHVVFLRSNPIDPDPRVEKEAEALYNAGYQVTIVGWDRIGNSKSMEDLGFARAIRVVIPAAYGSGIKNLPKLLSWQLVLFKWLITNNFDIIHSCDFDTVLPAYIISKIKKVKVVYDIFDYYADMLNNTPEIIKKLIKRIDFFIINHVDAVIIADDSRKEQIRGTSPRYLEVIYNTPKDIGFIKSIEKHEAYRICFVGMFQPSRGLEDMIELVSRHADWQLHIAGFGPQEIYIQEKAKKFSNIKFHGKVNYSRALELSRKADVLFALYDPQIPNHKYSSPNKLFEAMMLGKPIIVSNGSTMAEIVKKTGCGIVVEYGSLLETEKALKDILYKSENAEYFGINARKAYESNYGWPQMEKRLVGLYNRLLFNGVV